MSSKNKLNAEKEKKVTALISFAKTLEHQTHDSLTDPTLTSSLQTQIATLPLLPSSAVAAKSETLDALGTALWNHSTRLRRDPRTTTTTTAAVAATKKTLSLLRVFALLLLDTAQQGTRGTRDNGVRVLRVALKAAKGCVEEGLLEVGERVMERAAFYEGRLGKGEVDADADTDAGEVPGRLRTEYLVLRMALVWKKARLDLTEHFFQKVDLDPARLAPDTAEMLADMFYEIGRDMLSKRQNEMAVKWLDRAYSVIGEHDAEDLRDDAAELRLSIMQSLVRALLKLDDPEAKEKAKVLIDLLTLSHGDKLVVSLLQLEQLSANQPPDPEKYYSVMDRMMRSIHLTEAHFKTVMHHVHKLKNLSPELAGKALDRFLDTRLFDGVENDWIEKATITRIWVTITDSKDGQPPETLMEVLDTIFQNTGKAFNTAATHAAQTLLWKHIETSYSQGQFVAAGAWCRLASHPLFEKSGELNKAKIARKTILCALARKDNVMAREIYFKMSDTGRAAPMTRYLMYKVSLRQGDVDLASECLDTICRQSDKDATLLYACVMEAQQAGDKKQAITALQKVLERYNYGAPQGVHLPALLRCTTRLLLSELGTTDKVNFEVAEELVKLFETSASQAKNPRCQSKDQSEPVFSEKELDWFSRNSYNISLKYCASLHPSHLLRLLESCVTFIILLEAASTSDTARAASNSVSENLNLRLLLTRYLAASSALVLARSTDSIQDSYNAYNTLSTLTDSFLALLPPFLQRTVDLGISARADLLAKRAQLLRYNLEAALKTRNWDAMDKLFADCFAYDSGAAGLGTSAQHRDDNTQYQSHLDTLADLALVIHAEMVKEGSGASTTHRKRVIGVLQKIVNLSWQRGRGSGNGSSGNGAGVDVVRLARWIRCLFQLSLDFDEETAVLCVEHAISVAGAAKKSKATANANGVARMSTPAASAAVSEYPQDELEWLATTAFNRGVDAYCAGDDAKCRLWAQKALEVSIRLADGGRLHGVLMEKYSGLVWE